MANETIRVDDFKITPELLLVLETIREEADEYMELLLFLNDLLIFEVNHKPDFMAEGTEKLLLIIPLRELVSALKNMNR